VIWSDIGFEEFDEGQAPKLTPFWKKASSQPAAETPAHWTPAPFAPEITLRFIREQYLEALQAERMRLGAQQ
jgi:hypothetical protein